MEENMGSISTLKVAAISLILGPVIATICYFVQQLFVFADVEYGSSASWASLAAENASLTVITSIIIPLALMMLVYALLYIANEIRGNGNGDALASYSVPLLMVGFIGFVFSSGISISAANFPEPAAAASAAFLTAAGINAISGIFFSIGFAAIFFAMATRDEYNSNLAKIAGLLALVSTVAGVVGLVASDSNELMTMITGITYIVHTLYAIYIGRGLLKRE